MKRTICYCDDNIISHRYPMFKYLKANLIRIEFKRPIYSISFDKALIICCEIQ